MSFQTWMFLFSLKKENLLWNLWKNVKMWKNENLGEKLTSSLECDMMVLYNSADTAFFCDSGKVAAS